MIKGLILSERMGTDAFGHSGFLMTQSPDDDFTPQEAQERIEAAVRAAFNKKPMHRSTKKPEPARPREAAEQITPNPKTKG